MYSFDSRVRYSEVDHNKVMTASTIINYFQDCSNFQSDSLGVGIEELTKRSRVWIMSSWQLVINRYPTLGEQITIGTWPYEYNGIYGYRNFILYDEKKEVAAVANSIWVLLDTNLNRPVKITDEDYQAYKNEPAYPMEYADRKIRVPKELISLPSFAVMPSFIDVLNHVNNAQYIRMATDYVDENFQITQMRADYRKSALLGDIIYPKISKTNDCITVVLSDKEGQPYVTVAFYGTTV
ncbi:acyl-[acyl-carrier-protein] thioesterase [Lachnoclostridium sp.]|uniref:acyl-[acyl-carrier-protein] thioesterase n=1 Tax=Lachnoclostridium sp. TaxID=2028282 RepID=UPI0028A11BE2|nr:acyl-ACP thioesterase domain-containing protein [Lachnoclostridium sp.]